MKLHASSVMLFLRPHFMEIKKNTKKRIGEILIEKGFINTTQLERALQEQKEKGGLIGSILINMGALREEDLLCALSKQFDIPFIRLSHYNVNRNTLKLLPRELAERCLFFPFDQDEHTISIAISNPLDQEVFEKIEKRVALRIQVFLATVSDIREALNLHYDQMATDSSERW